MKKTLLASLVAGLIPMMAAAQGVIAFDSADGNAFVSRDSAPTVGVGAGFLAALYWAPTGSLEGQLTQLGAVAAIQPADGGYIFGGQRTTGAGTPAGLAALFQVRAWNNGFASYESALANGAGVAGTYAGKTALFSNDTADPNAAFPETVPGLDGWTSTLITTPVVPEPSTIALAGMGVAGLLAFRRRK